MMLNQPVTFRGFKVFIEDDRPRMQLGHAVREFLTPEQIADHNEWMLKFFGTHNWLKDGEYVINEMFGMVHMNPRTYERFLASVKRLPSWPA